MAKAGSADAGAVERTARALAAAAPDGWRPRALVVLGSGASGIGDVLDRAVEVPFSDIEDMPETTAPGHRGDFALGSVEGTDVLCMHGRVHPYDGVTPRQAALPVRAARALGAGAAVLTNAAGAINPAFRPGQVVLVSDHINMTGTNPLVGPNDPDLGPRYPDMTDVWTPDLRAGLRAWAAGRGRELAEGVYVGVCGPCFETPAEIRAFSALGADLVGMSTVWEAIAAAHCGMRLVGLSLVSNMAAGMAGSPLGIEDIERASRTGGEELRETVRAAVRLITQTAAPHGSEQ